MRKTVLIVVLLGLNGCAPINKEGIGTMTGGVVGGLLGSQFGGGSGKVVAAAGGALLGAYLGGQIGRSMDKVDQLEMQRTLETAPTGRSVSWKNPDTSNSYNVTPTKTYYMNQRACREYTTRAIIGGKNQEIHGRACRQTDGSWKIIN